MRRLVGLLDTLIYGLIAPFGILYVFPQFFLGLEDRLGIDLPQVPVLKYVGVLLLNAGAVLALVCAAMMRWHRRGSFSPFQQPTTLLRHGPYAWVRHPMMWAASLVLIGLPLIHSSPLLLVWLLVWCRFATVYIARYEEPYLLSLFGDSYRDYSEQTPRWFPRLGRRRVATI